MESYEDFKSEIHEKFSEIRALAEAKVAIEERTMWALSFSGAGLVLAAVEFIEQDLGYIASVKLDQTWKKIEEFAITHCFDCSGITETKADLLEYRGELETAASDAQRKIVEGLKDWSATESKASDNFSANFVDPIVGILLQQAGVFTEADIYLDSIEYFVRHNRKWLRKALEQLETGLNEYEPFLLVNIMGFHWGLVGMGLAVGPLAGAVSTAADMFVTGPLMEISGSNGKGTAAIFETFRQGIDTLDQMGVDTADGLAGIFHTLKNEIPIEEMTFPKPSRYDGAQ